MKWSVGDSIRGWKGNKLKTSLWPKTLKGNVSIVYNQKTVFLLILTKGQFRGNTYNTYIIFTNNSFFCCNLCGFNQRIDRKQIEISLCPGIKGESNKPTPNFLFILTKENRKNLSWRGAKSFFSEIFVFVFLKYLSMEWNSSV